MKIAFKLNYCQNELLWKEKNVDDDYIMEKK